MLSRGRRGQYCLSMHAYCTCMYNVQCTVCTCTYMAYVSVDRASHSICMVCSMSWPEVALFSLERKELSSGVATRVALSL